MGSTTRRECACNSDEILGFTGLQCCVLMIWRLRGVECGGVSSPHSDSVSASPRILKPALQSCSQSHERSFGFGIPERLKSHEASEFGGSSIFSSWPGLHEPTIPLNEGSELQVNPEPQTKAQRPELPPQLLWVESHKNPFACLGLKG